MVLASADTATKLSKIAEMADKIMEVAQPAPIAAVTNSRPKSHVCHISSLTFNSLERSSSSHKTRHITVYSVSPLQIVQTPPAQPLRSTVPSAGTIVNLGTQLSVARSHVHGCQTSRLVATELASPVSLSSCHLFYITDRNTGTHYFVDTGSEVSIIPPSIHDRKLSLDKLALTAVNNTPISTYGSRSLTPFIDP